MTLIRKIKKETFITKDMNIILLCIDANAILTGIATSFVASIIFTVIFTSLRPKLKISDLVAIRQSNNTTSYKIKVINKSRYAATNVKAELSYINLFSVPNGLETNSKKVVLNKSEIFSLDKFNLKSENASYTYMFVTTENIQNGLEAGNRNYLILRISATHSLSNMGKVFEKKFFIGDFANGDFCFGNSTEIS